MHLMFLFHHRLFLLIFRYVLWVVLLHVYTSVGGGTGSVMGNLFISELMEEYHNRMSFSFSVLFSLKVYDTTVDPSNVFHSVQFKVWLFWRGIVLRFWQLGSLRYLNHVFKFVPPCCEFSFYSMVYCVLLIPGFILSMFCSFIIIFVYL